MSQIWRHMSACAPGSKLYQKHFKNFAVKSEACLVPLYRHHSKCWSLRPS